MRFGDTMAFRTVAAVVADKSRHCSSCRDEIAAGAVCYKQDKSKLGSDLHWRLKCASPSKASNQLEVVHQEGDRVRLGKLDCVAVATRARKKGKCWKCSLAIKVDDLYYSVDSGTSMRLCANCVESAELTATGGTVVIVIMGAILVGLLWLFSGGEPDSGSPSASSPPRQQSVCEFNLPEAYILAQEALKRKLRVPSSADFAFLGVGDTVITADNERLCTYKVLSTVEARNLFGTELERKWSARVRYFKADGTFKVDFAKVLE